MAYPFHGIAKTIETAVRSKTRKAIVNARLREGYEVTRQLNLSEDEQQDLLQRFQLLTHRLDT